MQKNTTPPEQVLHISLGPHVDKSAAGYARYKIHRALAHAPEPVLSARCRLTRHIDPAVVNPVVAQATVDLNGRAVRVQALAATAHAAIDQLEDRLRRQLTRHARHWEAIRGSRGSAEPHEWRHGDAALPHPRPVMTGDHTEVVTHPSFTMATGTCDDAAAELETMDYGFQLFTESGSGSDSVLYRNSGPGYRLAQVNPRPDAVTHGTVPITVSPVPAPVLTLSEAINRLELIGQPFVFYRDRDSDCGNVIYHRNDGRYGVITPVH